MGFPPSSGRIHKRKNRTQLIVAVHRPRRTLPTPMKRKRPDGDVSVTTTTTTTAAAACVPTRRDRTASLHRSNTGPPRPPRRSSFSPVSRRDARLRSPPPPRAQRSAPQQPGMLRKPAERESTVQLTQNGVFDFDIEDDNNDVQQNPADLLRRYLCPTSPERPLEMEQQGDNGSGRLHDTGSDFDTSNAQHGAQRHGCTLRSEEVLQGNTATDNGVSKSNEIDVGTTVENGKTSYVQPRNHSSSQTDVLSDGSDENGGHCYFNNWIEFEAVSTLDYDSDDGAKPHKEPCGATKFPTPSTAVSLPADGIRGDVPSDNVVYPTAAKMMEIFVAKTCPRPPQQTHLKEPISRPYETTSVGTVEREQAELVSSTGNCRNNALDDVYSGDKPLGNALPQLEQNNAREPSAGRKDDNTVDVNPGTRAQSNSAPFQRKTVTFAPESVITKAGRSSQGSLAVSLRVKSRQEDSVAKNHCEGIPNSSALSRSEADKVEIAPSGPKRRKKSKNDHVAKSQANSSASLSVIRSKHPHSKSVSYPFKKRSLSTPGTLSPPKLDLSGNGNGELTCESRSVRSRRVYISNPDECRASKDSLKEQNICQIALNAKESEECASVKKIVQTSKALGVMKGAATELCAEDFACLRGCRAITDKVMNAFIALINNRNRAYFDQKSQKSSARTGGHLGRQRILRKNSDHFRGVEAIFNMRRPRTHMFDTSFFQQLIRNDYVYDADQHSLRKFGLNIDNMDLILTPIKCGNLHWALVAVDLRNRIVIYMNSMLQKDVTEVIPKFKQWLCDEVRSVMGYDVMRRLDIVSWSYSINPLFAPLQTDCASGGLFTLYLAEYLERAEKPDFTQTDIPTMRQQAIHFLKQGELPVE